jgi:hypothetical protein
MATGRLSNTIAMWGVRQSGGRLAAIRCKKGQSSEILTIQGEGFIRLSGATFSDGSRKKQLSGSEETFTLTVISDKWSIIFENPGRIKKIKLPHDSLNNFFVDISTLPRLEELYGGPGLSVKGRNIPLQKLVYFGQEGEVNSRIFSDYLTGIYCKASGDGSGIATLRISVNSVCTLTCDGNVRFCDSGGGNESTTANLISGANTLYFKCSSGYGYIYIPKNVVTQLGTTSYSFVDIPANAPNVYVNIAEFKNLTTFRGTLPVGFIYVYGAPPSGVTHWFLNGSNINWTYNGAPPSGVIYWYLNGNNINWTYNGAPPSGVIYWYLNGSNINWTYNGAPPSGVIYWWLNGSNINWTYNGLLSSNLVYLILNSNTINYTSNDFSGSSNFIEFSMINWRVSKITDNEMITILNSLKNREGSLPSTIQIGDYLNYANPPQSVIDAVTELKAAKNITTVTLSA